MSGRGCVPVSGPKARDLIHIIELAVLSSRVGKSVES
jgi:hypothetical protein